MLLEEHCYENIKSTNVLSYSFVYDNLEEAQAKFNEIGKTVSFSRLVEDDTDKKYYVQYDYNMQFEYIVKEIQEIKSLLGRIIKEPT